ncbi:homoserine kinase [Thermomicrobiaceae bacterium CFH 74404]|uniref:Homoserine kinase n=1 Tax=Thermalbibacter longus TaxID=2951981 RepID=A0AA41WEN0_9BACT|nr:homoserine kinase [Thermalbibacter longus]MCM8748640.1 homoserine kinase [Thermalbibacter longus]
MWLSVRVPASSANLGPGFDALAIALSRYLVVTVETTGHQQIEALPARELGDGRDLVLEAMQALARLVGKRLPGCRIEVESAIPVARGLGSSAAAIVGGLLAANVLLGTPLTKEGIWRLAWQLEGHGDNVTAALYGGAVLALEGQAGPLARQVPIAAPLRAVLLIPDQPGYTSEARAVLPDQVTRQVAIATAARCALLVLALSTGQFALLGEAMADDLHQPYRATLYPYLVDAIAAARSGGAYGACLSGSGPSVLALAAPDSAEAVRRQLARVVERHHMSAEVTILDIANEGATVNVAPQTSPGAQSTRRGIDRSASTPVKA